MTTQIAGEVIPSDVPGSLAMGICQPAGVLDYITNAPADAGAVVEAVVEAIVRIKGTAEAIACANDNASGLPVPRGVTVAFGRSGL